MRRISFSPQFVNKTFDDLIPGKIHTIRQNYEFWKRFEGQEVALFTWEGKPYRSKQKVFCIKRIVSVQESWLSFFCCSRYFTKFQHPTDNNKIFDIGLIAHNDGFRDRAELEYWFRKYKPSKIAILHFTDFRY